MASVRHNRKRKRRRSRLGVLFKLLCLAALVAAPYLWRHGILSGGDHCRDGQQPLYPG